MAQQWSVQLQACFSRAAFGPPQSWANSRLRAFGSLIAIATAASSSLSAVLRVNASAPSGGNGSSWDAAFNSIDTALQTAQSGDQLWIAAGTYRPESIVRFSFFVPSGVSLYGGFAGSESLLSQAQPLTNITVLAGGQNAGKPGPVLIVRNSTGTLVSGFTIRDGRADGAPGTPGGGGVLIDGGSGSLSTCKLINNRAVTSTVFADELGMFATGSGGALYVGGGASVIVWNCEFANNTTPGGAAVGWFPAAFPGNGGAIQVEHSTLRIENSSFSSNSAGSASAYCIAGHAFPSGSPGTGGAIDARIAELLIRNCSFTSNVSGSSRGTTCSGQFPDSAPDGGAAEGGAIYIRDGFTEITGSMFRANHSGECESGSASGGAISANGPLVVVNSRFLANAAGKGIRSGDGGSGGAISSSHVLIAVNCEFLANAGGPADPAGTPGGNDGTGGAVHALSFALLSNCTVASNTGGGEGAGVDGAELENSIVYGNTSAEFGQSIIAQIVNGSPWYCLVQGWPSAARDAYGNSSANPLFVDLLGPDQIAGTIDDNPRLSPGSPAIDSADTTVLMHDLVDVDHDLDVNEWIPVDLAGLARRLDDPYVLDTGLGSVPIVDRGAYEFFSTACPADLNSSG
jgi:hypothetical protein